MDQDNIQTVIDSCIAISDATNTYAFSIFEAIKGECLISDEDAEKTLNIIGES